MSERVGSAVSSPGSSIDQQAAGAWSRCWVEGGGPPLWPWPDLVAELGYQVGQAPELMRGTESLDRFGLFRTISDQLPAHCASIVRVWP